MAQLEFTVESTALVIDPLERKGYTFLGWTVEGYENVDSNISYIENNDKSITIPTGTCANETHEKYTKLHHTPFLSFIKTEDFFGTIHFTRD